MEQCDQLLRAAGSVAEQAEKARSILAKAAQDAERHIVGLPGIASQEAARVREAMRAESNKCWICRPADGNAANARTQKRAVASPVEADCGNRADGERNAGTGRRRRALWSCPSHPTAPKRRPDERPKSFELSDVLAAAERSEQTKPAKSASPTSLGTLQTALGELAVDLEQLAHDSSDPALWRKWLDGDRGVFARQLAASIGPESGQSHYSACRDNPRFHETADTYLAEFESMLTRARETDRDSLLESSLLTADTGKSIWRLPTRGRRISV
jgi:hypothetical protein